MTSNTVVVCVLNDCWRISILHDREVWRRPAWLIEQLVGDTWHYRGTFRSKETLLWSLPIVGDITKDAAAILAALPPRSDRRPHDEPKLRSCVPKRSKPKPAEAVSPKPLTQFAHAPPRRPAHEKAVGLDASARKRAELTLAVINTGGRLVT